MKQADSYYDGLIEKFTTIFNHPDWGSNYDFIVPNLYRYEYGSHSIYYQHKVDHVLIVRQDPARHL